MVERKTIVGFLHYRTDLGDGVRTGVYFSSCHGICQNVCMPHAFPREHSFFGDTEERHTYSASELVEYLVEEKVRYNAKPIGISFLGKEPLSDPFFCREVALGIKESEMNLHIHTCGTCPDFAFDMLFGIADLFVFQLFSPMPNLFFPFESYSYQNVLEKLYDLDRKNFPYRLKIPVIETVNTGAAGAFAGLIHTLKNVKSVILDFNNSGFTLEEQTRYRDVFRDRDIILY